MPFSIFDLRFLNIGTDLDYRAHDDERRLFGEFFRTDRSFRGLGACPETKEDSNGENGDKIH